MYAHTMQLFTRLLILDANGGGSMRRIGKKCGDSALEHGLERLQVWGAMPQRRAALLIEDDTLFDRGNLGAGAA